MSGYSRSIRALAALATLGVLFGQWERFRGPNGTGVSDTRGIPSEFGPGKRLIWRTALPPGHSSPIVSRGRIFLTGVENDQLYTIALDAGSGKIVWRKQAPRLRREKLHKLNHPASPTPVADGENVYVFFPDFGLLSYDWEGGERWRLPVGPFSNVYGVGVSPILADDKVIVVIDQSKDSFIVAIGKNDGSIKWRRPRPEALSGSSTPAVLTRANAPSLILAPSSFRMDAYSAADGEPTSWVRGLPSEMKSVPVVHGDVVYISGYNTAENDPGRQIALPSWEELLVLRDTNKNGLIEKEEADQRTKRYWMFIDLDQDGSLDAREWKLYVAVMTAENGLYAYRLGTSGDLTNNLIWKYQHAVPQLPSVVLYRDVVYMINDQGVLTTLDAASGRVFKQARLRGASANYYASPVAADGMVFIASHDGVVAVLKAGPDQELLSANRLEEDIFATPAIAEGRIYVRTVSALYCFGDRQAAHAR
jgi:outer membrane protein assembly factor BamB